MHLPTDHEINLFIDKHTKIFKKKWDDVVQHPRKKIKWSWLAFLFAPIWLAGQRMIYRVFIYFLLIFITALIFTILELNILYGIIPVIALSHIYYGLFGISLYKIFVMGRIMDIQSKYSSKVETEKRIKQKGGISYLAMILTLGVIFLFYLNLSSFMSEYIYWADFSAYNNTE